MADLQGCIPSCNLDLAAPTISSSTRNNSVKMAPNNRVINACSCVDK